MYYYLAPDKALGVVLKLNTDLKWDTVGEKEETMKE